MKVKTLKTLALAAGIAGCFSAHATTAITFDPTGTAGPSGNIQITTLDQAPGNALAVAANTASPAGTAFTLLYQANLGTAQNGSSLAFANGTGGNFFTFVAGFGEQLTSVTPIPASTQVLLNFAFDASNPQNFFRMYAGTAGGNDLAGTGFAQASAPILTGHFIASGYSSSFLFDSSSNTALDNFGSNDYVGTNTVTGTGSTMLTIVIDGFNVDYFPSMVIGATSSLINTSQILAFSQIDPSALFTNMNGSSQAGATSVGPINGRGTNTIFQADANQAFNVPEPLPVALIGMGLLGVGLTRRRSKKN